MKITFTKKAAVSLKARIYRVVAERLGPEVVDRLGSLFAGTIHSFCLRALQTHAGEYGSYELLDEHRQVALLLRLYNKIDLREALGDAAQKGKYRNIDIFVRNMDVVYNELLNPRQLRRGKVPHFALGLERHEEALGRFRLMTFGQAISCLVERLYSDSSLQQKVRGDLRHLFVDEYQDVNPAQEELIRILAKSPVKVTVVGDDDQSIYQWRGAHVGIIQGFKKQYKPTKSVSLSQNFRSRPEIIETANRISSNIMPRLDKKMEAARGSSQSCVFRFMAETPDDEASWIAKLVSELRTKGYRFSDTAILLRSVRTAAAPFQTAFHRAGIPWTCSGRSGLFRHPEAIALGRAYAFLVDWEWQDEGMSSSRHMTADLVRAGMKDLFGATSREASRAVKVLEALKCRIECGKPTDLVNDYYDLVSALGIKGIRPEDPDAVRKLSVLGRFSNLLTDYEHVSRRARPTHEVTDETGRFIPDQKVGASWHNWYYQKLCGFLRYYARDRYEDESPQGISPLDAVRIMTVHQAKGLEFPVVFMPSLVERRFPSSKAGRSEKWLVPMEDDQRSRYEGGEQEERRLFYVGTTRAREALYLSCFRRQKNRARPSRFLSELFGDALPAPSIDMLPSDAHPRPDLEEVPRELSFSELMWYRECPYAFRMRKNFGFQPPLARELGYGSAKATMEDVLQHDSLIHREHNGVRTERRFLDHVKLVRCSINYRRRIVQPHCAALCECFNQFLVG